MLDFFFQIVEPFSTFYPSACSSGDYRVVGKEWSSLKSGMTVKIWNDNLPTPSTFLRQINRSTFLMAAWWYSIYYWRVKAIEQTILFTLLLWSWNYHLRVIDINRFRSIRLDDPIMSKIDWHNQSRYLDKNEHKLISKASQKGTKPNQIVQKSTRKLCQKKWLPLTYVLQKSTERNWPTIKLSPHCLTIFQRFRIHFL